MALHRAQPRVEAMVPAEFASVRRVGRIARVCRLEHVIVHGCVRPALTHDLGRDALRDFPHDAPVADEQRVARVRLDVDEAGGDDEAARVHALAGVRFAQRPWGSDASDPVARDRDIAVEPGVAGAVHDAAPFDHDIVRRARRYGRKGAGSCFWATRENDTCNQRDAGH